MSIHLTLHEDLKNAMREKNTVRLNVVRGLLSAFVYELVAQKRPAESELKSEEEIAIVSRAVKQRKDAIEQFEKGGRADLADSERAELTILQKYLPDMMDRDAIKPLALAKMQELGITDKSKAGQLTGALMKDLKGKADGGDVKAVVDALFS